MATNNIANGAIAGLLTAIGTQLYNKTHKKPLNFSEVVFSLTCIKQNQMLYVFPLVSGIFITSGILFDWMRYQGVGKMVPFGLQQNILVRTSMYGFAASGFCQGMGSRLMGGDLIFFAINEILRCNWFFILMVIFSLTTAIICSFLVSTQTFGFLSNKIMNPIVQSPSILSANITIALGVVLITIAIIVMKGTNKSAKTIAKKIGLSFLAGVIITFGAGACGLANRTLVFNGLTPAENWDPVLVIFLTTYILASLLIHSIISAIKLQIYNRIQIKTISRIASSSEIANANTNISRLNRLVGAIVVGIGWGVGGIDMLAYLMHSAIFTVPTVIIFGGFLILGTMIGDAIVFNEKV